MEELVDLVPDSSQEDLVTENTLDGMEGEQTWPTEEELRQVEQQEGGLAKKTMRIPRGTSDYQAAWIMEDSRPQDVHSSGEDEQESEDEAMGEAPPVEEDAGCSQEGSEDEEGEGGEEEEDMMDEEQSETVANTEDYDAKHVRFRYQEYLL
jgi:pre-rRNA-processing protein TSR1